MARTAPRPFRTWFQAQLELRGIVGPAEASRLLGVAQPMVTRYLAGDDVPSRKTILKIAHALGMPVADVQDAVDADHAHAGQAPPPALAEQLEQIKRAVDDLAAQLRAGPLPTTRVVELPPSTTVGTLPGTGGRYEPVVTRDPRLLAHLGIAPERPVVVWVFVDATTTTPGVWVRVGDAEPAVFKPYEPGDRVTGVLGHFQGAVNG